MLTMLPAEYCRPSNGADSQGARVLPQRNGFEWLPRWHRTWPLPSVRKQGPRSSRGAEILAQRRLRISRRFGLPVSYEATSHCLIPTFVGQFACLQQHVQLRFRKDVDPLLLCLRHLLRPSVATRAEERQRLRDRLDHSKAHCCGLLLKRRAVILAEPGEGNLRHIGIVCRSFRPHDFWRCWREWIDQ